MKQILVHFCALLLLSACTGKTQHEEEPEWVKVYPSYKPQKSDSIVPAVEIYETDTKSEIGVGLDTPDFLVRSTGDAGFKINANKWSSSPDERTFNVWIEGKKKHCVDTDRPAFFYFRDQTYIKWDMDDPVDGCDQVASFSKGGQFWKPEDDSLWNKLLRTPLYEIRIKVQTQDHPIIQRLTKDQAEALTLCLQRLDTATRGIPKPVASEE